MLELQKTPLWIWVLLCAVKCCACLSADHCSTCYISLCWIGAPYWDIWLRRKWNAATYRRCWVLTTWAMLFSKLLRQSKGSWPKMPSLNRIKQAQGTPASKWRWCSDTSGTPCALEIRRGLTRKARANWRFITWRTQQKALSGVKTMTPKSSHVSLTSAAWAFWSGLCWPGSFPAASNCKCIKALAWSSKTPRTSVCVVFRPVSNGSPLYPDVPGAKKMKDLVVWFCYVFGVFCFVQRQQFCDHFVMGWN